MNAPLQKAPKLPDSVERCHALIEAQAGSIDQLLRRLFGTRSERFDPNQTSIFKDEEIAAPPAEIPEEERTVKKKKGHGRKPLPKNLPRERVEHDVTPEEKVCTCGGEEKKRIGKTRIHAAIFNAMPTPAITASSPRTAMSLRWRAGPLPADKLSLFPLLDKFEEWAEEAYDNVLTNS